MTSFSAKSHFQPKQVVFVVYPDIVLLDLSGPLQVFSHAMDQAARDNGYSCAVTSHHGGMVDTNTVVPIATEPMSTYADRPIHTLVIVGGDGAYTMMKDAAFLEDFNALAGRAQRVCSVCSGALILAAAGILNGRRAVTHWEDCKALADGFPDVRVEMDPIYIKDDHVWTSAGITAGMDMALAIVAEDLGRTAALKMARSMVTPMARSGGQSQFSPVLVRQVTDAAGRFEDLHQWIADNLALPLHVDALAEQMNMTPRTFARAYSSQMGITPAKAVEAIRTDAARDYLETTDFGIKQIAALCGFNDEERMRRAFIRLLNVPPTDYRQGFKTPDAD
ncbi:helix-turn-helix domain-containing protein [Octadecabacter sp. G9-8]|uniref:Helix-turn-helix domain-containing protein n=1 Tax=Octadecabacter dasysiphoniae TaxID=2909341 RepID=A0ABS9D0I1_9RHOB|nr:helix-turn-helix domain-containing protein [Octadecabacter dasysiphoniae]MCF2872542.1 helix-turn-helix domain-containing protein [Octadecabacter dasysiphoniae]